jgi:hypothetical protein
LRYLKAAYEQGDSSLLYIDIDSQLDGLHNEPGYPDLIARMNLAAQN